MQFFKTVDSENILRLEEEGGAAITIKKNGDKAQILSILVPKGDREEGIGSGLLAAAEQVLAEGGIKTIEADYSYTIKGMSQFFEHSGYTIDRGAPIVSVGMKAVLSSLTVKRALANIIENATFVPISDLMIDQLDALLELLSGFRVNLSNSDIAHFMHEASGVVYDEKNCPQAFILCSEQEDGVLVDLLAAIGGSNPKYIIAAICGMINGIISAGGAKNYEQLYVVACNTRVNELLSRVLKKGNIPDPIGFTAYASKTITGDASYAEDVDEDIDEDLEDEWRREIKKVPLQSNICWKMYWFRNNKPEANPQASESAVKKTAPVFVSGIRFTKDEDITEGLSREGTVRITMDNLSDFEGILPAEVYGNMPRPFYRGLAVLDGGEVLASMVWQYIDIEDDRDTCSNIEWFGFSDADAGRTLIEEYISEISQEDTVKSTFEFDELSDEGMTVLREAGFNISNEEGSDVVVPLSVIKNEAFAEKKPYDYIKSLETLNEKQFKRGIANSLFHNRKGLLEDAAFLSVTWFEQSVSCCVVADNKVVGMFLIHKTASERLFLDLLFSVGAEYQTDLLNMLRFSVHAALSKYSDDTEVVIRRHSDDIRLLVSKLIPDQKGKTVYYGERRES
ncbi:MAG: hypothetical protein K6B14_01415 [Lachnospiraceae bacterium]|nr:hypothetical protein [Lachnospiraceae bacterium]